MSDHSITIVPKQSSYPNNLVKAREIVAWLVSMKVVKPILSNCVLSADKGYAISDGARQVTNFPSELPFDLTVNGLELITERHVFHTGENGMEECVCPNCNENIALEDWSFINDWYDQTDDKLTCPLCNVATEIHQFSFSPEWGFSDLGFTFWNWPDLTDTFVQAFKQQLGCDISIVYTHI